MYLTFLFLIIIFLYYKKYFNKSQQCVCKKNKNAINTILRGSSRYGLASLQDKSPLVALLHANYAAGYFWALRDAFSDKEIRESTNLNIVDYQNKITNLQDSATKQVLNVCKDFAQNIDLEFGQISGQLTGKL